MSEIELKRERGSETAGEGEAEWTVVQSRKRQVMGSKGYKRIADRYGKVVPRRDGKRRERNDTMSYYFTNFPENWDANALWKMFLIWGKAVDVYVPLNRDKYGGRYGFVKFIRVVDAVELEKRLQQIWIGLYKVRVHRVRRKEQSNPPQMERDISRVKATGDISMARSYADVVSGKGSKTRKVWRPKNQMQSQKVEKAGDRWYGIHHTVTDDEMTWLAKCYVGQLHNPDMVFDLQEKLLYILFK